MYAVPFFFSKHRLRTNRLGQAVAIARNCYAGSRTKGTFNIHLFQLKINVCAFIWMLAVYSGRWGPSEK